MSHQRGKAMAAVLTLISFSWFCLCGDYAFAQEASPLEKAQQCINQGKYDDALTLLTGYIQKIRAIAVQQKNVAEAYYLLAKTFYEIGEEAMVEESLREAYRAYPVFDREESNAEFKEKALKIRKEMALQATADQTTAAAKPSDTKFLEKVATTYQGKRVAKKRFPWLLVLAGTAAVAAILLLTVFKSSDNITGAWLFTISFSDGSGGNHRYTFEGNETDGTWVRDGDDSYSGTYDVAGNNVTMKRSSYYFEEQYSGTFSDKSHMSGTGTAKDVMSGVISTFTWTAVKES